jgi:hypothetical protein
MSRAYRTHREKIKAYKVLVGNSGGKRLLGRHSPGWENNISTDVEE